MSIDLTNYNAVMSTMLKGNGFDAGLINRSIATLAGATAKTDARTHATAMAIMYRSNDNFDCSAAVPLVNALGKGGRANAMIAWLHKHTNVRFTATKGQPLRANLHKPDSKMYRTLSAESFDIARTMPYWDKPSAEGTKKFITDDSFITKLSALLTACDKEGAELHNADNIILLDSARRRVAAHKAAMLLADADAKYVAAADKANGIIEAAANA
jgi:hypothetical protein